MLMRLFRAAMPKAEGFIDDFCRHSEKILAGAEALRALITDGGDIEPHIAALHAREAEADAITRKVEQAIHRTFITPFDRLSIHDLITRLDDIIDLMEEAAQRIQLYGIRVFTPEMKAMADNAVRCAALIRDGMPLLGAIAQESVRVSAMSERIRQIEGETDTILYRGLAELFTRKDAMPAIDLMALKEVYELLESIVDRCDDVADVIDGIMLEQV